MRSGSLSPFCRRWLALCVVTTAIAAGIRFASLPASKKPADDGPVSPQPASLPVRDPGQIPARPVASLSVARQPSLSDSDGELLQIARDLVAQSPEQTVAWAAGLGDPALRERFLFATLRAWGEQAPAAAVDWALGQDEKWRFKRMEAALTGAARQPAMALEIGRGLLAGDAAAGRAYGTALVGALSAAGQFQTAVQLADEAPPDSRAGWLEVIFTRWAQSRPEDAVPALASVPDGPSRARCFQSLVKAWAASNPSTLAGYAASLPDGDDRSYVLENIADTWPEKDPAGFVGWLNTSPPGVNVDRAVAALIAKTDGASRSPEAALNWVGNVSDPDLKHRLLLRVLGEWNQTDPAAAQQCAANISWLDGRQRQDVLNSLRNPPPTIVAGGDD